MFTCSQDWLKESTLEETICFLKGLALDHASRSGPFADQLSELIRKEDWRGLVDYDLDYSCGFPEHLANARQALGFFTKLKDLPLGVNTEDVAYAKFRDAERRCLETNRRLRSARSDGTLTPSDVAAVIFIAQRKIQSILGPVPSLDKLNFSFGPGANTTVKATASSARWKLDAQLECSCELAPVLPALLSAFPHWSHEHRTWREPGSLLDRLEDNMQVCMVPVSIGHGKLMFVEKNAKTKRSIVVEPLLNAIAQKGIGDHLKKRLRKVGIDLEYQAEVNKALARSASIDGSVATIDLSAASDTISYEVVFELLPFDWACFLRNFRTSRVAYKEELLSLEKFSSMGNAFTFELETLIFWSLAWAVTRYRSEDVSLVHCFGDDILLPTDCTPLLTQVLEYLGFEINLAKSFWSGRFRESCGGDYVSGFDIRPYYQKVLVSGESLFVLHNYYMRTFQPEMAARVLDAIPESLRLWGPDGYGDGHLIGDWSAAAAVLHKDRGFSGVTFETFSHSKRRLKKRLSRGDVLLPLYSIYVGGGVHPIDGDSRPSDHYVVRGHKGYKRIKIYTHTRGVFCP